MRKYSIYVLMVITFIQSCKKESADPTAMVISADITTATTFDKITSPGKTDYIVTVPIEIKASVIINPGVIIVFKRNADFTISSSGSLNATGTLGNPVLFRAEEDVRGFWGGLYFKSASLSNKLIYCLVENAGGDDHTIPAKNGAIIVYGSGLLELSNSQISKSGGFGLILTEASSVISNAGYNMFKTCALSPVNLPVSSISYLDASSVYAGNDLNYIDCIDDATVTGTQTWHALDVPYLFPESVIQIGGDVSAEPGVHIKARQGGGIQVKETGSLEAVGTATDDIIFEGDQAIKGYWAGIQFNSLTANNRFDYVTVSDGGNASSGFVIPVRMSNIEVNETGSLEITHSTIKNSNGYGIRVISGGLLTQSGNSFIDNADVNIYP